MDNRWANIDLVFRNGLKDFEALPPEDVWDNVKPAVSKKRSYILVKAAASVVIVLSIGFAAYMIGRSSALNQDNLFAGFSPQALLSINQTLPIRINAFTADLSDGMASQNTTNQFQYESGKISQAAPVIPGEQPAPPVFESSFEGNNVAADQFPVSYVPGKLDKIVTADELNNGLNSSSFQLENVKPEQRWSIAALVSPTYYSKSVSGNDAAVKSMIASEKSMASMSGGFSVSYRLSRRFTIQTGLYYSSHGQQVEGVNSYTGFQKYSMSKGDGAFTIMTSDGPVHSGNADVYISGPDNRVQTLYSSNVFDPEKASLSPLDNSIIQKFGYLQMPLTVRYKFLDRGLGLDVIGGISYDFLVDNSAFIKSGGAKYTIGKTDGLNNFIFSSSIGMGMEYSISTKMTFNIEPTFRYFLNSFNEASASWIHPYSFGVFTGFSYKF